MPTGSGKTLVEALLAFYFMSRGSKRILVIEPTRFLCDQMTRVWSRLFGDLVERQYEGKCSNSFRSRSKIIISTPQTALKCAEELNDKEFEAIVIDEVHHTFGNKIYETLLDAIRPKFLVGMTALLPSYRASLLSNKLTLLLGKPLLITYDFKELQRIDPLFNPPKAIADLVDAEMNYSEEQVYNSIITYSGDCWTACRRQLSSLKLR